MTAALSANELHILNQQVAVVGGQFKVIKDLLESRLGEASELTIVSQEIQYDISKLSELIKVSLARQKSASA